MQKQTAIVTDSNVSLSPGILVGLPLFIVPLEIHHEGRVYRDGIDITPSDFYSMQARSQELPKTSAPKPGAFLDAYREAARFATNVLCITLASNLSSTHDSALIAQREAAEYLPETNITVVDSKSAGTAQGLIALEAARSAARGDRLEDVLASAHRRIGDVCLYGYLDTLYYVWKGGRVPRLFMWMGNLLQMKPVLQLYQGNIGMVERPRTAKRAMERLVALASDRLGDKPGRMAVMHANAAEQAQELADRLRQGLNVAEMFITEFTPVIGAHTGPGLVGCALHPLDD